MRTPIICLIGGLLMVGAVCGEPPRVIQGSVIEYQSETNILLLSDQQQPGEAYSILLDGSEMGKTPEIGDVVRVSCRTENGRLVAIRVMDISPHEGLAETE